MRLRMIIISQLISTNDQTLHEFDAINKVHQFLREIIETDFLMEQ